MEGKALLLYNQIIRHIYVMVQKTNNEMATDNQCQRHSWERAQDGSLGPRDLPQVDCPPTITQQVLTSNLSKVKQNPRFYLAFSIARSLKSFQDVLQPLPTLKYTYIDWIVEKSQPDGSLKYPAQTIARYHQANTSSLGHQWVEASRRQSLPDLERHLFPLPTIDGQNVEGICC